MKISQRVMFPAPKACSPLPFWFWNDELTETEISRQIADFELHGVHGFVLHPRIGLPRHQGWMSDELLHYMGVALAEAERRKMMVLLYDEGMYPSGSSAGQVVAKNPDFACRGLAMRMLDDETPPVLPVDQQLLAVRRVADGRFIALINRKIHSVIRGLHYLDETSEPGREAGEDTPPMADILNPASVQCFMELVYERFYRQFSRHFGRTVLGVFTDEPNALGRCCERDVHPFTTGILPHLNAIAGYDLLPHLPALWLDGEPDAARHRRRFDYAIRRRMEQTWYQPLSQWCADHGVALCGHPAEGDEIGVQRFFHIPGQDLVWRHVEPDRPSALEGPQSTQAKATSSAMIHLGRSRNSNEFCGAYGSQTSFDEFQWLANWCLVRGVNMLIPHAFYYSVRGPRRDERPPQVGPHGAWWDRFTPFAEACKRLCWVNTDSRHVCDVAILTDADHCPWQSAKACYESQWDFNYLEDRLLADCRIDCDGIHIAGMHYRALIVEDQALLSEAVRERLRPLDARRLLVRLDNVPRRLSEICVRDVVVAGCKGVRVRHVVKGAEHLYLLFNEESGPVDAPMTVGAPGPWTWIDPVTGHAAEGKGQGRLTLAGHEMALLRVKG